MISPYASRLPSVRGRGRAAAARASQADGFQAAIFLAIGRGVPPPLCLRPRPRRSPRFRICTTTTNHASSKSAATAPTSLCVYPLAGVPPHLLLAPSSRRSPRSRILLQPAQPILLLSLHLFTCVFICSFISFNLCLFIANYSTLLLCWT